MFAYARMLAPPGGTRDAEACVWLWYLVAACNAHSETTICSVTLPQLAMIKLADTRSLSCDRWVLALKASIWLRDDGPKCCHDRYGSENWKEKPVQRWLDEKKAQFYDGISLQKSGSKFGTLTDWLDGRLARSLASAMVLWHFLWVCLRTLWKNGGASASKLEFDLRVGTPTPPTLGMLAKDEGVRKRAIHELSKGQ